MPKSNLRTLLCLLLVTFLFQSCLAVGQSPNKAVDGSKTASVSIDPKVKYQLFEGFGEGGMDTFTPAWYEIYRPAIHEMILDSLYTLKDKGLGLNICRFLMPMGDNPEHDHWKYMSPLANKPFEPEDGVFAWDGHENILWRAEGAQKRGATMWASFYSVPYWLSVSGCSGGSKDGSSDNLIAGKEGRFAKHICDVLKHFKDEWKIDFEYVSPLNECEANWWKYEGGSPGCHVSDKQAIIIIRELAKQLKADGLDAKIQALDAAYGSYYWYMENLLKSDIEPEISVMSVHQYITTDESLEKWHELAVKHKKSLWSTEWGDWKTAGYPDNKPYEQAINYARKLHEGLKVLKANAWILWEPGFIYDANMFWLKPRKAYWVVAQYTRHVRPGMQQIASVDSRDDCKTTVWIDTDAEENKLVIVTVNDGSEDLSVKYDLGSFKGVKITEIFRTSKTEDYASLPIGSTNAKPLVMDVPAGSVVTITCSYN